MSSFDLAIYFLCFYIPTAFSIAFRAFALGYTTKKRLALGFCAYTGYMILIPALLVRTLGLGQFANISSLVMLIAGFGVFSFTTDSPAKTIFLQFVQCGMTTAVFALFSMIRRVLDLSYPVLFLMLLIASAFVYIIALRLWAKPLRFVADNIHDDLLSRLVLPMVTLLVICLIPVYPPQVFAKHPVFCTLMVLAAELGFFLYVYMLYCNLSKISILSRQELKNELLQAEIISYRSFLETARQNRHDLRHHDALILEHLAAGDVDGARRYLLAHDKAMEEATFKQFCQNITANAVFRLYERLAQDRHVAFSITADIPQELPLTPPEIGSLLGNLLENAMNACEQCTDTTAYIRMTAEVEDDNLLLELRNSAPETTVFQNGIPVSGKPNGGTGTRSVMSILKSYEGIAAFTQQGSEFLVRIILPL